MSMDTYIINMKGSFNCIKRCTAVLLLQIMKVDHQIISSGRWSLWMSITSTEQPTCISYIRKALYQTDDGIRDHMGDAHSYRPGQKCKQVIVQPVTLAAIGCLAQLSLAMDIRRALYAGDVGHACLSDRHSVAIKKCLTQFHLAQRTLVSHWLNVLSQLDSESAYSCSFH